jgi:hypothetical protein
MNTHADKSRENITRSVADSVAAQRRGNRVASAPARKKLQAMKHSAVMQQRPLSVIQRSDDPEKAMASMEKHMSETEQTEEETIPRDLAEKALRELSRIEKDEEQAKERGTKLQKEKEVDEGKKEPASGIIGQNMGAYMAHIKKLEAEYLAGIAAEKEKGEKDMQQLRAKKASLDEMLFFKSHTDEHYVEKCDYFIKAVYEACRNLLLPNLGDFFPKLNIEKKWGENEASFGSREWDIAIQRPEDFKLGKADAVFKLSSTFLHETRHVEQDWIRIIKRDPNMIKQDKPKGVERMIDRTQNKLPKDADLGFMKDIMTITPERWTVFFKSLELHKSLGQKKQRSPAEEEKYNRLDQQYRTFPVEADAYKMEAIYKDLYEKNKGRL